MIINLLARMQANFGTWLLEVAARICMLPYVEIVHKDIEKGEMMMILSTHAFMADVKNLPPNRADFPAAKRPAAKRSVSQWGSS